MCFSSSLCRLISSDCLSFESLFRYKRSDACSRVTRTSLWEYDLLKFRCSIQTLEFTGIAQPWLIALAYAIRSGECGDGFTGPASSDQ